MTEEFEEDVFGEMDDIRGDNRVAVPDVGHIRRRVATQHRAAGIALAALLMAGLGGFWATRPGSVEVTTADDATPVESSSTTPDSAGTPTAVTPTDATPSPWVLRNPTFDPSSNVVEILVSDQSGCTSGRRADDRITYELDLTQTEVTITALTTALEGGQNCPSNPFTPLTIALGEPVGDRALIDGSGKVVDQYEDYSVPPGPLFRLSTEPPLPPITPATAVTSESLFYIEARCEVAEDSFEDRFATGWTPDGVFADPDHVIASAVAGYGLSADGWHLVESTDGFGQTTRNWTQYLDGVPKASLLVGPAMLGWGTAGAVCDLGGPWIPDSEPPADRAVMLLTGPTSELADVSAVLEQVESLSRKSDGWTFDHEGQRCTTWIEVEKALERTGHVIQTRYEVETIGQSETWQLRMSVVNNIGELAVLSTSGQGQVTVSPSPLPKLSPPRGLPWESGLGPCWLDTPISPDRE